MRPNPGTRLLPTLKLLVAVAARLCAAAAPSSTQPPLSQSTACGTIVNTQDTVAFNASLAYECLTSVPFVSAVATSFLQYLNDTFQFQSSLAYLKNPPSSYQQPSVDLLAGLSTLQQGIQNGLFSNQYEFEAALQALLFATHDAHVNLFAGALAVFGFGSSYELVSLSVDGIKMPQVYLAVDLVASNSFTSYTPSAIASINGIETVSYLTQFASNNSYGTLEPHADWNQLMLSAAQDIQGVANVFNGGATFYPGDNVTFHLENGTEITDNFLAVYYSQGNTGPLQTGGDFYNFFVLGFYPDSYDPDLIDNNTVNVTESSAAMSTVPFSISGTSSSSSSSSANIGGIIMTVGGYATDTSIVAPSSTSTSTPDSTPTCTQSWGNAAYPDCPDIAQPDLGAENGGYVSGYFLNDTSISVLSIPSFDEYNATLSTFSSTVAEFITASRAANLNKIVIDVQSNAGGQPLLAIDTFKHFFPNIDPFAGSRLRAHHAADVIGQTTTTYFQGLSTTSEDLFTLIANEWVATERIDANTNRSFISWSEFFGPQEYNGDEFTTTQRYNLSNTLFSKAAVGDLNDTFVVYGYGNNSTPANEPPPYTADNIILLSDGLCDSACALFMEMMHHEAGVRIVVAGGRPSPGPMQAPSGSRGALEYTTYELDSDISFAQTLLDQQGSPNASFLPNRTNALEVYVTFASINLRDEIRQDDTLPLQFAYEAADCRIFYTPQTVYNYTALWQYAADAIWKNSTLCVNGSIGFASTGTNQTDFVGPTSSSTPGTTSIEDIIAHLSASNATSIQYDELEDVKISSVAFPTPCSSNEDCLIGVCAFTTSCGSITPTRQCLSSCFPEGIRCGPNGATCRVGVQICDSPGDDTTCQLQPEAGVCPLIQCGQQQGKARAGTTPQKIKPKKVTRFQK